MLNFENADRALFYGVGKYDIPEIEPVTGLRIDRLEWIPFNYAKTAKDRKGKGIHFYVDDYQFVRLWNRPDDYIPLLQEFGAVCSPDFSLYTDMPRAMQIYNHYRKHWLAAYWQMHGITVIPTLCWSTPDSFAWCLCGEPKGGIVSISSVGTQNNAEVAKAFAEGARRAIDALQPSQILWYGKCPAEFDWNVTRIEPHQDEIVKRRLAKWAEERVHLEAAADTLPRRLQAAPNNRLGQAGF